MHVSGQETSFKAKAAGGFEVTFDPPNDNHPRATKAGASRGDHCALNALDSKDLSQSLTPVLPSGNFGLTLASHPIILAHIPSSSARKVFLTLKNSNEEEIFQTILPISSRSGIITINIPEGAPPLIVEENYKWSLALMCDDKLRPDSPIVEGFIKRVQPESSLVKELTQADIKEKAFLYGEAGIWYETVSTLAELRRNDPQNDALNYAWIQLLENVGLENIANAEIVD